MKNKKGMSKKALIINYKVDTGDKKIVLQEIEELNKYFDQGYEIDEWSAVTSESNATEVSLLFILNK